MWNYTQAEFDAVELPSNFNPASYDEIPRSYSPIFSEDVGNELIELKAREVIRQTLSTTLERVVVSRDDMAKPGTLKKLGLKIEDFNSGKATVR